MWKPNKSRAEHQFAATQKKDDPVIKQKEKSQRERDERMARLRDLRLAKEAAEQQTAVAPDATLPDAPVSADTPEALTARLPKVHSHRS
jgi:hypothetical protein